MIALMKVLSSDTDSDRRGSEEYESDSSVISETSDRSESLNPPEDL